MPQRADRFSYIISQNAERTRAAAAAEEEEDEGSMSHGTARLGGVACETPQRVGQSSRRVAGTKNTSNYGAQLVLLFPIECRPK